MCIKTMPPQCSIHLCGFFFFCCIQQLFSPEQLSFESVFRLVEFFIDSEQEKGPGPSQDFFYSQRKQTSNDLTHRHVDIFEKPCYYSIEGDNQVVVLAHIRMYSDRIHVYVVDRSYEVIVPIEHSELIVDSMIV